MVRLSARAGPGGGGGGGRLLKRIALVGAAIASIAWVAVASLRSLSAVLFTRNPTFTLRRLDLTSDGRLAPDLLQRFAGIGIGTNLFELQLRRIRSDLMAVPAVREVRVRRRMPDTLEIRIQERLPIARIVMPGTDLPLVVDADGWIIVADAAAAAAQPLLTGFSPPGVRPGIQIVSPEARDALRLLDLCARSTALRGIAIREVRRRDFETFSLVFENGDEVWLPRQGMDRRLNELPDLLRTLRDRRGAGPLRIDMTGEINHTVTGLPPR